MLMIVAHHYVVCSGLTSSDVFLESTPTSANSLFMAVFGAWGKTGINCFLMITGYFMCTSKITLRKFIKLMAQIYFYKLLFYLLFFLTGYETFSLMRTVKLLMPTWGFTDNFTGCFIGFWLTIPFLNVLVQNMTKRQHELLLLLLMVMYTFLGSIPTFNVAFNYVTWFGIIYFIASYIRLYPRPLFERRSLWGWLTFASVWLAVTSLVVFHLLLGGTGLRFSYFFLSDSNKILAVTVAVCSFLWFKNMKIKYSKVINAFGAATFGVLLIHAGSHAMLVWLWKDTVDVIGHFSLPIYNLIGYSIGVVIAIFIVCNLIDQIRIATVEKWFFKWYDQKIASKADSFVNIRILKI